MYFIKKPYTYPVFSNLYIQRQHHGVRLRQPSGAFSRPAAVTIISAVAVMTNLIVLISLYITVTPYPLMMMMMMMMMIMMAPLSVSLSVTTTTTTAFLVGC